MQIKRFSTGFLLATLAVAALVLAPAMAQGRPGGHGPNHGMADHGRMMARIFDQLDLSDEQRDQIHQIMEQSRDETRPTRDAMRAGRESMADLMHAETIDEAAIRDVAEEIAAGQVELMVAHARAMSEMREVLTPEQLEQFRQMRQQRMQMQGQRGRGKGHKHGYHHGQPPALEEGSAPADEQ
jgi:Spy/CpxP family protein refolding chaperone